MINVYSLNKNDIPFYIGITKNQLNKRLTRHQNILGYDITISLVEQVEENEWKYWECFYIEQFRQWGFKLINKNKGGGGLIYHTQETRDKISIKKIGYKCKKFKSRKDKGQKENFHL